LIITANTLASFTVNSLSLGSNRLYFIKIIYLSLDNSFNAFYSLAVDYNSLVHYFYNLVNSKYGHWCALVDETIKFLYFNKWFYVK
jgi:hypothetical protein